MQVKCFAVLCCSHKFFCTSPVFVFCVLSKEFFFKSFDTFCIAVAVEFCTFFHSSERSPALWIYDISIFECFCHVVCLCEGTAGFLSVFSCNSFNFWEYFIAFRMSKYNVHTETSHQTDDTLRNGERFAIRWRVSPGHSDLFAFKVFNTAKFMDDVKHISHSLCRMVDIALKVNQSRFLLKDTVFVALCYSVNNFMHVFVAFADVHIITDTDNVSHEGDHVSCFTNCFAVSNLRFAFIQILNFKTKKVTCGSKGETCTCRVITE